VPIASGLRTTVLTRLTVFEQVMAIENDPHFQGGNFYGNTEPEYGLALARMISHKTFVHLDAIERRARGDVVQPGDQLAWYRVGHNVESYMLHQGKKFVKRFDANTYLRICDMWLRFDPLRDAGAEDYGALFATSRRVPTRFSPRGVYRLSGSRDSLKRGSGQGVGDSAVWAGIFEDFNKPFGASPH